MALKEIERKFLVKNTDFIAQAHRSTPIVQAFLNTDPSRTVRVRLKGEKGYLTVKGKSEENGASRFEWEKEITPSDVHALLPLCEPSPIEKTRYEVWIGDSLYEVPFPPTRFVLSLNISCEFVIAVFTKLAEA